MTRGVKPAITVAGASAITTIPAAPAYLAKDAKAEWRRVMPQLIERKTITDADMGGVENYCSAIGEARQAARIIAGEGLVVMGKTGLRKHPAVAIRADAENRARLLAAELGLTPVSRSRPAIRDEPDPDDVSPLDI